MTPAAIRIVSQLRQEFYCLFSVAMKVSVNITGGSSSASNPSMVFWNDSQQRLNYVYIYAHTAPDELVPERPFVLRVAINKSAGTPITANRGKGCRGINQSWHFELTLLPEEILDFLPWTVGLIKSYDSSFAFLVPDPPHPLEFRTSDTMLFHSAQTCEAGRQLAQRTAERSFLSPAKP